MGSTPERPCPAETPPLPRSIWVVAWCSLAGQALALAISSGDSFDMESFLLSAVVSTGLVAYVVDGVLRARPIRYAIAMIASVLSVLGGIVVLLEEGPLIPFLVGFALAVAVVTELMAFRQSDWYAWQRTRPPRNCGASLQLLMGIAVAVGLLVAAKGQRDSFISIETQLSVLGL